MKSMKVILVVLLFITSSVLASTDTIPKKRASGTDPLDGVIIPTDLIKRLEGVRYDGFKPMDVYASPDGYTGWIVQVEHVRGNKFRLIASSYISGGRHMFSQSQPLHPWGKVFPTRIYLAPRANIKFKGRMVESAKVKLHKCKADHRCVTDHDRRIYGQAIYKQTFKVRGLHKREKNYMNGVIEWRTDTESEAGTPVKYGFTLVFGVS